MKKNLILFLLFISIGASAQTSAGRIFIRDTAGAVPTGFTASDFLFTKRDSITYQRVNGAWVKAVVNLNAKNGKDGKDGAQGIQGIQGVKGADGVCPPCSTTTGTTNTGYVRWVTNWNDFLTAYNDINCRAIYLGNDIVQTSKWNLRKYDRNRFLLEGNGYRWTTAIDTAIVRRFAALNNDADQGIEANFVIRDVMFIGDNKKNDLIYLSSTYGTTIEDCTFKSFKNCIGFYWSMLTIVRHNIFTENTTGIICDYDKFIGGSNYGSQSNHFTIEDNKFRNSTGDFSNIKVIAASGGRIIHNIFEGQQAGGDYDIYWDDNGSTVVKDLVIDQNHTEHIPAIASVYIRANDGVYNVGHIFTQYACTLIWFDATSYSKIKVENIPYLPTGTKFKGSGRWWFIDMPGCTFDPTNATWWVAGFQPPVNVIRQDGWDCNGQFPFIQLGSRRL